MANGKSFYQATLTGQTAPALTTTTATGDVILDKTKVIGTGFNEQIKGGDWLLDLTNLESRRVDEVVSDTELILASPFNNSVSGALSIVDEDISGAVYMELTAVGDITVDGVTVIDGSTVSFGNNNASSSETKLIKPRFITGIVVVNLEYFNNNYPS